MKTLLPIVLVLLLALPAFAVREPLADQELDRITAQGPEVAGGGGAKMPGERVVRVVSLILQPSVQRDVMAVSVQNVAGRNQVAISINLAGR
jgi:hypothetical protein